MNPQSFLPFPKMARLSRNCIITEKLDGTNAQVFVWNEKHQVLAEGSKTQFVDAGPPPADIPFLFSHGDFHVAAGSRTQWITPVKDNHGFARWVAEHAHDLLHLGHGRHFGEWWGSGIQRGYGLPKGEKRFSLFNVMRWCLHGQEPKRIPMADPTIEKYQDVLPGCCGLVPVLYDGPFTTDACEQAVELLRAEGSKASPGFDKPEGIVCFHVAANFCFKKTLEKDEVPKALAGN